MSCRHGCCCGSDAFARPVRLEAVPVLTHLFGDELLSANTLIDGAVIIAGIAIALR